jgi:3-oxoacyl-[acyl-carrier-protein] synthase III
MPNKNPAYLSAIAAVAGTSQEVASLGHTAIVTQSLLNDGFSQYFRSDLDVVRLISYAAGASLKHAGLAPKSVDGFMVVTESFWDVHSIEESSAKWHVHDQLRERLMRAFRDLGITHAVPYANWLSSCGNLGPSIGAALGLVHSNQHRCVLLAAADRLADGRSRLTKNNMSVVSDAAAACIITDAPGEFEILGVFSAGSLSLISTQDAGNSWDVFLKLRTELKGFDNTVADRLGRRVCTLQYIIADNAHSMMLEIFRAAMDIVPDRFLTPSKPCGHMFAVDTLWSLRQLVNHGMLNAEDVVGLLNIGDLTWSLVVLRLANVHALSVR